MVRLPVVLGIVVGLAIPLFAHAAVAAAPKPKPATGAGAPIDADTLPKNSADAVTTIRWLDTNGKYQLEVQNTSGIGYIDTFNWSPPPSLTITAITSAEGGHCSLVGGNIHCSTKLAPPKCTCEGGGVLTVNFTANGDKPTYANGYWTYYGVEGSYLQIQTVTPVPYHIPSFLSSTATDLPLCAAGKSSTKAHPCSKT
jgi:hypothetical protein